MEKKEEKGSREEGNGEGNAGQDSERREMLVGKKGMGEEKRGTENGGLPFGHTHSPQLSLLAEHHPQIHALALRTSAILGKWVTTLGKENAGRGGVVMIGIMWAMLAGLVAVDRGIWNRERRKTMRHDVWTCCLSFGFLGMYTPTKTKPLELCGTGLHPVAPPVISWS